MLQGQALLPRDHVLPALRRSSCYDCKPPLRGGGCAPKEAEAWPPVSANAAFSGCEVFTNDPHKVIRFRFNPIGLCPCKTGTSGHGERKAWSKDNVETRTPGPAREAHRGHEEPEWQRTDSPSRPSARASPADGLTSALRPPDWERVHFCSLSLSVSRCGTAASGYLNAVAHQTTRRLEKRHRCRPGKHPRGLQT